MKSFFLRYGLGSILFLILIFISLLCIQPSYEALNRQFESLKKELISYVEDNFGVTIRYSSLSPSILTAFFIRNIEIRDSHTASVIAKIGSIYLKYNFVALISEVFSGGEVTNAFSELIIDGMNITYSENENSEIRASIVRFIEKLPPDTARASEKKHMYFPFAIILRNISAQYIDKKSNSFSLVLNSLSFTPDQEKEQFIAYADGNVSAALLVGSKKIGEKFGLHFRLEGNTSYNFATIGARLHIDGFKAANYTVSKLSFGASLVDSILTVKTLESGLPFSLFYTLDSRTGIMTARMKAEKFDPSELVDSLNNDLSLNRVEGSTLSGIYDVFYNSKKKEFRYSADGSAYINKKLIPGGMNVSFKVNGDTKNIGIHALSVRSPQLDASFSGSYNIAGMYPLGEAAINSFVLPNGNILQAEIFIEHQNKGFMLFIPQLDLGGQYLTALELSVIPEKDSADFTFQMSDYSHAESDELGIIALEGSFLYDKSFFLQSRLSFSTIYLDSVLRAATFFLPQGVKADMSTYANLLSPYVISNELYISSDFKSISFNAPALIIANTQKDREFLVLSCTGNESNINVSQLDLLFAGQSLQASFEADIAPDYSNLLFNSAITFNTIAYNFTGTFFPGAYLGIQGDYGFEVYVDFNTLELVTGSVRTAGLPVQLSDILVATSVTADFEVPASGDWKVHLSRFEIEELSSVIPFKPRLSFAGQADRFGLFLNTVIYSDRISTLNGTGSFSWSFDSGIIDTVSADISLLDSRSAEKISLVVTAANPERRVLSAVTLLNQLYVSLELDLTNISFARFFPNQTANNTLSASISALGTLNSPFLSARVENASISLSGIPVAFEGTVQLNDGQLTLQNSRAEVIYQTFSALEASVDLKTFTGEASGIFDGRVLQETITAPFILTLENNSQNQGIGENFTASLSKAQLPDAFTFEMILHNMSGTLAKNMQSGIVHVNRTQGRYDFYAGYDRSFNGHYTDDGSLMVFAGGDMPVRFFASGSLANTRLDLKVRDLYADTSKLQPLLTYPFFHMSQGILTGQADFTGLVSDPSFSGTLKITDGSITSPQFVDEPAIINEANFIIENNVIISQKTYAIMKRGKLFFDIETYFDGWRFTQFKLHLLTDKDTRIRAHFNDAVFGKFSGDASCDLELNVYPELVSLKGGLLLDNTVATLSFENLDAAPPIQSSSDTLIDLTLELGKKPQLSWVIAGTPILRALAVPQTLLNIKIDTATGNFDFKGTMELRGGDFIYLSRSFYIREGKIIFNLNQDNIDPIISFRAETRERDDKGEQVRIILTAENQPLSEISPKISSSPPMSEYDLMALLGQVLFTDMRKTNSSAIGTLATVLDYGAQATVFRKVENQLRNWLNFDIFSLRTAILQNAVLQTYNLTTSGKPMTPGNFFDNSTVYIGKYFGNALYGDALLHLSYDETKLNNDLSLGGLVFEPEIGLEMASPFATIRWSLAPDIIDSANNLWVPFMSIRLSWKFSF